MTGCAGLNGNLLSARHHSELQATTSLLHDIGNSGIPIVSQIMSTFAALGGGILTLDYAGRGYNKVKRKKNVPAPS